MYLLQNSEINSLQLHTKLQTQKEFTCRAFLLQEAYPARAAFLMPVPFKGTGLHLPQSSFAEVAV